MEHYETIKKIFENHNWIVRTSDITSHGIHNSALNILSENGIISKIRRGVYEWIEDGTQDDIAIILRLFPDSIICMYSALFYFDYTDRTPDSWHLAFDKDINKKRLKVNYPSVKAYFFEPYILNLGISNKEINGQTVKMYDRDRVICDILRFSNKIDAEIFNKALQGYIQDHSKNVRKLTEYARELRVYKKIKQYLEVWM